MQTGIKELETYEHIIQNLSALKEEAVEIKPKETGKNQLEAYERIIQNLSALKEEAVETEHLARSSGSDRGYITYALRPT